jgi:ABC-type multidrug transport system fused ATPase/permease subunit
VVLVEQNATMALQAADHAVCWRSGGSRCRVRRPNSASEGVQQLYPGGHAGVAGAGRAERADAQAHRRRELSRWSNDRVAGDGCRPLVVDGVTLRFGGITALDGVSFTVAPGSIHALIGPNGAGKSSCFNVISGLYRPTSGTGWLGDTELTALRPHRLAGLASAARSRTSGSRPARRCATTSFSDHHLTRGGSPPA